MVEKVGVVGAGQMGSGIAQVAATVGYSVILVDVTEAALLRGMEAIRNSSQRLVKKGVLTPDDQGALLSRIQTETKLQSLQNCDLVIEAITENLATKTKLFQDLDGILKPSCYLASNTSSISITRLASSTKRADRVAGMHFMNPVPLMKLVEGIRGLQTSQETIEALRGVATKMEKVWIEVKDFPGFVVNRILMPMINEAFFALQEGLASPQEIDEALKLGTNQPMGPLTLADFIGLDTCLAILRVLHEGFGDPKFRPAPLLIQYVEAGWLGRKTGRGVYQYG